MSSGLEAVAVSREGRVAIVTFQPAEDGTISNKGAALLVRAVGQEISDEGIGAIVLTGKTPGVFIRHANVAQIGRAAKALAEGQIDEDAFVASPFARLCHLLDEAPKPVIAAINGPCMGGGFEIALACTMRIAAPAATHIGLPEIRIGIPPGAGGPQRLARLIGERRALLFALAGRTVDAAEAARLGIVDAVGADALKTAMREGAAMASRPAIVVEELMRQLRARDGDAIDANLRGFARCLLAPGTRDALDAFVSAGTKIEDTP